MLAGDSGMAVRLVGAAGGVGAGGGGGAEVVPASPARIDTRLTENVPARARKITPCSPGVRVPSEIGAVSPLAGTAIVPSDLPSTSTSTRPPLLAVPVSR